MNYNGENLAELKAKIDDMKAVKLTDLDIADAVAIVNHGMEKIGRAYFMGHKTVTYFMVDAFRVKDPDAFFGFRYTRSFNNNAKTRAVAEMVIHIFAERGVTEVHYDKEEGIVIRSF